MKLAIILVILSGCVKPETVTPRSAFTPTELAYIQQAADKWSTIVVSSHRMSVTADGRFSIYKEPTPKGFVGWTNIDRISIDPSMVDGEFYAIVLHEMGHAQGLQHIAVPGVMNGGGMREVEFSAADLAECKRVGACA